MLCDHCKYIEYFHSSCPAKIKDNDAVMDYGIVDCTKFEWRKFPCKTSTK